MALTDREKELLSGLAEDVRRTDRRLHLALTSGHLRPNGLMLAIAVCALAGTTLVITGDAVKQPWLAIIGWLSLIAAALLNVGRDVPGAPPQDGWSSSP